MSITLCGALGVPTTLLDRVQYKVVRSSIRLK